MQILFLFHARFFTMQILFLPCRFVSLPCRFCSYHADFFLTMQILFLPCRLICFLGTMQILFLPWRFVSLQVHFCLTIQIFFLPCRFCSYHADLFLIPYRYVSYHADVFIPCRFYAEENGRPTVDTLFEISAHWSQLVVTMASEFQKWASQSGCIKMFEWWFRVDCFTICTVILTKSTTNK